MHGVFYGHVKCVPVAHPALAEWGLSCTFRLVLALPAGWRGQIQ